MLVHFEATSFSLSTTVQETNEVVITVVHLQADDVEIDNVIGALTAGSSCRTVWQNDKKATKKQKAKEIPAEVTMKWGEWIGTRKVQRVIVQQARKLTSEELFAQAKADSAFAAQYAEFLAFKAAADAANASK